MLQALMVLMAFSLRNVGTSQKKISLDYSETLALTALISEASTHLS